MWSSVHAMSVNEWPVPATRTVRPTSAAAESAAATSSSEPGSEIT